jgi:hypothetical protein
MPVATLNQAACCSVEGFVRDALGCACPPAVFEDIRLETGPAGFPEIPGARLLAIGGRLLVLLVDGDEVDPGTLQLGKLLRRGRELRDNGGFNRFRLVLVAPQADSAGTHAAVDPDSGVMGDDRLHLHTIAPAQLPAWLRTPAVAR